MSYGSQSASFTGTLSGGAQIGGLSTPAEPNRVEQLLNMAGVLVDQVGGLASRIESLDVRMFGSPNVAEKQAASPPPQPVRPSMDELQHRLNIVHNLVQRGFDAMNRLDRL